MKRVLFISIFFISFVVWPKTVIIEENIGESAYSKLLSSLQGGDELVFPNGVTFHLEKKVGEGGLSVLYALSGRWDGAVLRLPRKKAYSEEIWTWVLGQVTLDSAGVNVPKLYEFSDNSYAVIENITYDPEIKSTPKLGGEYSSVYDIEELIKKQSDPILKEKMRADFIKFARSMAPIFYIDDLFPHQMVYSPQRGWILLDFHDAAKFAKPLSSEVPINPLFRRPSQSDLLASSRGALLQERVQIKEEHGKKMGKKMMDKIIDLGKLEKIRIEEILLDVVAKFPYELENLDSWVELQILSSEENLDSFLRFFRKRVLSAETRKSILRGMMRAREKIVFNQDQFKSLVMGLYDLPFSKGQSAGEVIVSLTQERESKIRFLYALKELSNLHESDGPFIAFLENIENESLEGEIIKRSNSEDIYSKKDQAPLSSSQGKMGLEAPFLGSFKDCLMDKLN